MSKKQVNKINKQSIWDITLNREFWYGSKFDTSHIYWNWSQKDFLKKVKIKNQEDIIYENWVDSIDSCSYKQWGRCHICNEKILTKKNYWWSNIDSIMNYLSEKYITVWPFHDKNWTHYIDMCENCMWKFFAKEIKDPYENE